MQIGQNFLSVDVSPIENARRMAEHNAQGTEYAINKLNELSNIPLEKFRIIYLTLQVGLIALGLLIARTKSLLVGGIVALTALIPNALLRNYDAKIKKIENEVLGECENNIQFICMQISQLFLDAMKKRSDDLVSRWNNGKQIEFSNFSVEKDIDNFVTKNLKQTIKDYNEQELYNLKYNNQTFSISYVDLKNYASSIAKILPEGERDCIKKVFSPNNFLNDLQKICAIFIKNCKPEIYKYEEDSTEYKQGRKFILKGYTAISIVLKECLPRI